VQHAPGPATVPDSSTRRGRTGSILQVRCYRYGLPRKVAPTSGATTGVIRFLAADSVVSQGLRAQPASPEEETNCAQDARPVTSCSRHGGSNITPSAGLVPVSRGDRTGPLPRRAFQHSALPFRVSPVAPRQPWAPKGLLLTASASVAEISRTGGLEGTVVRLFRSPW